MKLRIILTVHYYDHLQFIDGKTTWVVKKLTPITYLTNGTEAYNTSNLPPAQYALYCATVQSIPVTREVSGVRANLSSSSHKKGALLECHGKKHCGYKKVCTYFITSSNVQPNSKVGLQDPEVVFM